MATEDRRTAVVTGAGRGIGEGIARRLSGDGLAVAVLDMDEAAASKVATSITDGGGTACAYALDVRDGPAVSSVVAAVAARLGPPAVLVNNAGIARDNLLFRMSDDDWDEVIAVHLRGAFLMTRAVQTFLVPRRSGRIVNISSPAAAGVRGQANYATAKAGIIGLTATTAIELGPFGITANAIAPGFVSTAMSERSAHRLGLSHEEFQRQAAQRIALRRVGRPEDIAGAVSFLIGPDASFVNGALLHVTGGP